MNTRQRAMNARLRKSRMAKLLLVCVLFVGMFAYIGMLAGISGQTKRADALSREMVELSAQRDNLEVSLSMLKNPERIARLAAQMGMQRPTQDAIRVVNLPVAQDDAQTQTAGLSGGEGVVQ